MPRKLFHHNILFCLILLMVGFFLSMRVFNDGVPGWKHIITSDGRGYYAYLPALILDHDPAFSKVKTREAKLLGIANYKPSYLVKSGDRTLNKYFAGEALLLLPFFLAGTLASFLAGTPVDGYSFFFQLFAGLGSLFYLFLGLLFLKRILGSLNIRDTVITITIAAFILGTNLFYYSLWQPTMSHVFSFFSVNAFLWFTILAIRNWNFKTAAWMGFFLGIVCLVRPTNVIVILLIPFLAGTNKQFFQFTRDVRSKMKAFLFMIFLFLLIISLQILLWYIQTGRLFTWSYRDEGFNFGNPQISNVLFSYRKGLFIYTPLILLSLTGLVPLMFRNRMKLFSIAIFLITGTWIIASWWNWYYGDGFGLRAFIDYYGVFAILLAIIINLGESKFIRPLWAIILFSLVVFNMVQTWQYTHQVIQPNSMNAEKYQYIWMRTDSAVINSLGGNEEIPNFNIGMNRPVKVFASDFEKPAEGWTGNTIITTSRAFSGKHAGYLDSLNQYSPGIAVSAGRFGKLPARYFIKGEAMVWDSLPGSSNGALVVLSMDSIAPGENYWWGFRLNDIPVSSSKTWRKITFSLMLPEISNAGGILKVYIWNTGKKPMLVDDVRVEVYGKEGNE